MRAGDNLVLILHRLPAVRLIGENTGGSFDRFRFHQLLNGWYYSLPDRRMHNSANQCYEGTGAPVDFRVVVSWWVEPLNRKVTLALIRRLAKYFI